MRRCRQVRTDGFFPRTPQRSPREAGLEGGVEERCRQVGGVLSLAVRRLVAADAPEVGAASGKTAVKAHLPWEEGGGLGRGLTCCWGLIPPLSGGLSKSPGGWAAHLKSGTVASALYTVMGGTRGNADGAPGLCLGRRCPSVHKRPCADALGKGWRRWAVVFPPLLGLQRLALVLDLAPHTLPLPLTLLEAQLDFQPRARAEAFGVSKHVLQDDSGPPPFPAACSVAVPSFLKVTGAGWIPKGPLVPPALSPINPAELSSTQGRGHRPPCFQGEGAMGVGEGLRCVACRPLSPLVISPVAPPYFCSVSHDLPSSRSLHCTPPHKGSAQSRLTVGHTLSLIPPSVRLARARSLTSV